MDVTGRVERLGRRIRRVLAPNPSPFTYTGTQTYIIGEGDVAVIDPGPDLPAHLDALAAASGASGSPRSFAPTPIATTARRAGRCSRRPARRSSAAPRSTIEDDGPRADEAFDSAYRPDRVLADGERLDGAGWTIEAVATPGPYLQPSLLRASARKAPCSPAITSWAGRPPSSRRRTATWPTIMASLERLLARDDLIYYPAHGPAVEAPHDHVRRLIEHRRMRERQIIGQLERGEGRIPAMVEAMYADIDPRLFPAAGRSVLAHLVDLERRGLVREEGERWTLAD